MTENASFETLPELNESIVRCRRCPRLVEFREEAARNPPPEHQDKHYWARPVPGFGDPQARLLVLGLAPGAHGSNRTGRMFTGHRSAQVLMKSMHRAGFANQPRSSHRGDGLELQDAYITAVIRCAPPEDRMRPEERRSCRPYLERELEILRPRIVVALGRYAYNHIIRIYRERGCDSVSPRPNFEHNRWIDGPNPGPAILMSYHPSLRNLQTGTLTPDMLNRVFERARGRLS